MSAGSNTSTSGFRASGPIAVHLARRLQRVVYSLRRYQRHGSSPRIEDAAIRFERVLGIRFLNENVQTAITLLEQGGLMVVPSGPGLATLATERSYREAVTEADFAIVDSAYLALLWLAMSGTKLHRVSGLAFLREFVSRGIGSTKGELFLVNPTDADGVANLHLLHSFGYELDERHCYTAPIYAPSSIIDPSLIEILETHRPRYIMLNVGGGTQEQLGWYLKRSLSYSPAIICTGAAIAFLTGRQASIPEWTDALGLGWLARSISNPRRFVPRYARALSLIAVLARHRSNAPP